MGRCIRHVERASYRPRGTRQCSPGPRVDLSHRHRGTNNRGLSPRSGPRNDVRRGRADHRQRCRDVHPRRPGGRHARRRVPARGRLARVRRRRRPACGQQPGPDRAEAMYGPTRAWKPDSSSSSLRATPRKAPQHRDAVLPQVYARLKLAACRSTSPWSFHWPCRTHCRSALALGQPGSAATSAHLARRRQLVHLSGACNATTVVTARPSVIRRCDGSEGSVGDVAVIPVRIHRPHCRWPPVRRRPRRRAIWRRQPWKSTARPETSRRQQSGAALQMRGRCWLAVTPHPLLTVHDLDSLAHLPQTQRATLSAQAGSLRGRPTRRPSEGPSSRIRLGDAASVDAGGVLPRVTGRIAHTG